ncbi:MAG: Gfo/Idh/MocA family oxidoreductase [Verrucomicrobia bacterium]|nr:Gfo/Idh/MocA family oxidoreductase [Verrucomicrobiota bacterium]
MTNRRHFLHTAAAFATLPALLPRSLRAADSRPAPSQRLGVGVIGLGDRGSQHLGALLGLPDVQVVGVCDPFRPKAEQWKTRVEQHYAAAQPGSTYRGCAALQDFRELLARPDLDAVFIAAPENWHALMSLAALRAGKDVYCEKALALTVAEGRAMCDGVRRYGRVFQTGTQQRSERGFRLACELARNGHLGKVHTVKVSVPGGRALPLAPPQDAAT